MDNSAFKEKCYDSSCRTPQGKEDADLPLYVSCCGYQNFLTKDFSIQRPTGRLDYQILYIHKGCGHFFIDNEWQTIPAGSIVVYLPSEPQIYTYYAKDTPEIYWIHFSGTQSLDYLQRYHIHNCYIGRHRSLTQLFDEIILELHLCFFFKNASHDRALLPVTV